MLESLPWYAYLLLPALLAIPAVYIYSKQYTAPLPPVPKSSESTTEEPKTIMQPPVDTLPPPLSTPYTPVELAKHTTTEAGIYVAIKGTVFDVTRKADVYGPGKSYSVFAGKDGSRGLGMSSLKPEDAVADIEGMDPKDRKVLDEWYVFFEKRYPIVGKVVSEGEARL